MRISDWSSDVCSSDLVWSAPIQIEKYDLRRQVQGESMYASLRIERQDTVGRAAFGKVNVVSFGAPVLLPLHVPTMMKVAHWVDVGFWLQLDRTSVVSGSSVSVRVVLGGRSIITKK